MRIKLTNFRCYESKEFILGREGLTLISGVSGKGKSTILLAIFFALYGSGSKVIRHGATSCRVELEFDGMTVVRSKRPNHLIVDGKYENDAGQSIIHKKFGANFDLAGYIPQNAMKSFIVMSPHDKLSFLERFAFNGIDLPALKQRCKEAMQEANRNLISTVSKLEMASAVLDEMEKPSVSPFPIKCSPKHRSKAIRNETVKHKNSFILLKRNAKKHVHVSKELSSMKNIMDIQDVYHAQLETVKSQLDDVNSSLLRSREAYEGDDAVSELRDMITTIRENNELINLERMYKDSLRKLDEMESIELDQMKDRLLEINTELWKEYGKDETQEVLRDTKNLLVDSERAKRIQTEIDQVAVDTSELDHLVTSVSELEDSVSEHVSIIEKMKLQKQTYVCPSCDTRLHLRDGKLAVTDGCLREAYSLKDAERDLADLRSELRNKKSLLVGMTEKKDRRERMQRELEELCGEYVDDDLLGVTGLDDDIEYLRNFYKKNILMEKEKKLLEEKIKSRKYSPACANFRTDLQKTKSRIDSLQNACGNPIPTESQETLLEKLSSQTACRDQITRLESTLQTLESEKTNILEQLSSKKSEHEKTYSGFRHVEVITSNLNDLESERTRLVAERDLCATILEQIKSWREDSKNLKKYREWQTKVSELRKQEGLRKHEYAAAGLMKEKILEAESLSIHNIISSINSHAKVYLDTFFVENPISVRLEPFKETKSSKTKKVRPQIHVTIIYKNMESDLGMLSGGELSRVILSFTMALAEIFNSPLLMLDECTASLDEELSTEVINSIREHFNGKLVLLIAHQATEGVYDQVVRV